MTNSRKARGRETEHLVARTFAADGWPFALPTGAGAPGRDITGIPGVAVEVKARAGFDPQANLRQVRGYAGPDVPLVVLRCNGQGPATIDDWPAFTNFGQMRSLLRDAGYGTPQPAIAARQRAVINAAVDWRTADEDTDTALKRLTAAIDDLLGTALSAAFAETQAGR